jgi:hypothetical protein
MDKNKDTKRVKKKIFGILIYKGILKNIHPKMFLGIVQSKFGSSKAKQFKNFLEKIDDINHPKRIKKEVIRTKTWEDFIKFIQNSKNSKKIQN